MAVAVPVRDLFINGDWVAPVRGQRLPIINPATEQQIGTIPAGTPEDVQVAVEAAKAAFDSGVWAKKTGAQRGAVLRKAAEILKERKPVLAKLETLDCGKPLPEAEWDLDDVAGCFEYYAGLAEKLDQRQNSPVELPADYAASFTTTLRYEPIGLVAAVTPWNYPLLMAAWKVAPALAAGCSVILKPSEVTSVNSLELAAICFEAGVPAGVFNVITGLGAESGAPLVEHPLVDKVAFTGSTVTGSRIMTAAARDTKAITLELGGKSALIIFDDVEIDKAVEWAMFGCFWTNGQICSATSRVLVHESIAPTFFARLKEETEKIQIKDPLAEGCRMGPVVNDVQYKKVLGYIQTGIDDGAHLLTGGGKADFPAGYFIKPTVFTDVPSNARIWKEEIFGPVMSVRTFKSEDEAIAIANDSEYGLAGGVISKDEARCKRVAEALRCGIVWINCSQPCFVQAPWGGLKKSGFGRDLGEWGLENYISPKQVTTYISPDAWGWYMPAKL